MSYYSTNFGLAQHHKWSITEIENMMPWERDAYMSLLMNHLKEEQNRIEQQNRS